jgi:uncharacterized protein (TIGR02246 family)
MAVAVVAACAPAPPPEPMVDVAAEEAAIRALSARWLELEGARDAAAIAGLFADDGRLVWSGQDPVIGPAAIQAFLVKEYAENPKQTTAWTTERVMIAAGGDMAVEYGAYANAATGMDGMGTSRGSYVTVYQKAGGAWKIKADASASATPSAPSGTSSSG